MGSPRPAASRPLARPFTLGDLMILIVGLAVGIAWVRATWKITLGPLLSPDWPRWRDAWEAWLLTAAPVLAALGLATLACRFRSPRPALRRVARQPGATALLLLAFLLLIRGATLAAGIPLEPLIDRLESPTMLSRALPRQARGLVMNQVALDAGGVIAAGWLVQAVAGRWRAERSWADRVGQIIGFCLIALDLLDLLGWAAHV